MSLSSCIVNVLESNTLELEDSLKSYERGIAFDAYAAKERLNDTAEGERADGRSCG